MRGEQRTRLEKEANETDLMLFRLQGRMEDLAALTDQPQFNEDARAINRMRWRVRRHMHKQDIEVTGG